MGGPTGNVVTLNEGDFVLIPPGVSHQQLHATPGIFSFSLLILILLFRIKKARLKNIYLSCFLLEKNSYIICGTIPFLVLNLYFQYVAYYQTSQKLDFLASISMF